MNPERPSRLRQSIEYKRILRERISGGAQLDQNQVNNIFQVAYDCIELGISLAEKLPTYEEEVQRAERSRPKIATLIMELSDPSAVTAFNEIIFEMRSHSDQIMAEGRDAIKPYLERARALLEPS